MKKILVLATGGTIASLPSENGLVPGLDIHSMLNSLDEITANYQLEARDLLSLDSSNIQPEEWVIIARAVAENCRDYDGIVVTHGTDTMAYTASALSFMLRGLRIPVVLTGSQLPLPHPLTDALENIRYALAMAATGVPGVFIAFNRKIILGCRAVKIRTTGFDAFESVNFPYIATPGADGLQLRPDLLKTPFPRFELLDNLCPDVFLIKLTPGFNPKLFDMLLEMRYRGVVIEAFGAGGLHYIHRDLFEKLQLLGQHDIPVVVASQCLYEKSDLSVYEVGKRALEDGVIGAQDMTTEGAVTKLMWALGQTDDIHQIRALFMTDFCGEITL